MSEQDDTGQAPPSGEGTAPRKQTGEIKPPTREESDAPPVEEQSKDEDASS